MIDWEKEVSNNKKSLKPISVKTYACTLRSLSKKLSIEDANYYDNNPSAVMKHVNKQPLVTKKNLLTALLAVASGKKAKAIYTSALVTVADELREDEGKQQKTERQEAQWKSQEKLEEIYTQLEAEAEPLFKKKSLTWRELRKIESFVLASCYLLIPPRRVEDYRSFRIRNVDEKGNYMLGKFFVFNQFKTAEKYGTQKVKIPSKLVNIIKKWMDVNDSEWLLRSKDGKQLSTQNVSKLIKDVFGSSINVLRHIYVSDVILKDVPKLTELQEKAEAMGHNTSTQMLYKKVD